MTGTDMDASHLSGVQTFMGMPYSRDLSKAKAAVLGIPFDCGLHAVRLGARTGPAALRTGSTLVRPYQPPLYDFNVIEELGAVDCGNVDVVLGDTAESFRRIEEAVWAIVETDTIPVTFGGDGAVTLPQLRALSRKYPDLAVLHFDAHTDTYQDSPAPGPGANMPQYDPSTTFSRAADEGVVDPEASMHVGPRGTISQRGVFDFTRSKGYGLISGEDMAELGIAGTLKRIHERMAGRPVYLCWDMDVFDPSCAPGVFTPTWGGLTAREGLDYLHGLRGLDFVAFDVNTLSPLHDVGGMSAFLAATVAAECLFLAADRLRRGS